jgi:hypothetical protein
MHPLLYPTILADIQDELCDLDYLSSSSVYDETTRSLKPTLRTVAQVCKQWRESTLARQSCWITKLDINGYDEVVFKGSISRAARLLDEAQDSDIDFCANLPDPQSLSLKSFQDFVEWMDDSIFSVSHRVRVYKMNVGGIPEGCNRLQTLVGRFMAHAWPRLRSLCLYNFGGVKGMEISGYLPTPNLHRAEFRGIAWKGQPVPLPRNGVSVLDVSHPFHHGGEPDPNLLAPIPSSPILLATLSRLTIHLGTLQPRSEELPELPFTQLSELNLHGCWAETVWNFLKSIRAPSLTELTVTARKKLGNIPPEPVQFKTLHNLRRLDLRMCACWFLPIIMALPARDRISTLTVNPTGEDEDPNHRSLRERFIISPMQFEGLQDLTFNCFRGKDQWFLSTYHFLSARNQVILDDIPEECPSLPNARKLVLRSWARGPGRTFDIEAPALEHLWFTYPLSTIMDKPDDVSEPPSGLSTDFGHLNHIFSRVKILELRVDDEAVLTPGDLIPFSNVKTLILNAASLLFGESYYRLFRWVSDQAPGGGLYLPQLSELVINTSMDGRSYKAFLEATRDFLTRRQEHGSSISILTLSAMPHSLREHPVLEWFRQNQSFSLKISTEYIDELVTGTPLSF